MKRVKSWFRKTRGFVNTKLMTAMAVLGVGGVSLLTTGVAYACGGGGEGCCG